MFFIKLKHKHSPHRASARSSVFVEILGSFRGKPQVYSGLHVVFLQLGVVGHFPVEAGEIADAVKHARISVRAVTFFVGQVDELCFFFM